MGNEKPKIGDVLIAKDDYYSGKKDRKFLTKNKEYPVINILFGETVIVEDDQPCNHGFYAWSQYFAIKQPTVADDESESHISADERTLLATMQPAEKQQHTPEPWSSICRHNMVDVFSNENLIARAFKTNQNCKADAARIIACVNAMAGIDDPEDFMRRVRALLAKQDS